MRKLISAALCIAIIAPALALVSGCAERQGPYSAVRQQGRPAPLITRSVSLGGPEEGGINWMKWGKEAFEKAEKLDRLIYLDISATWCHWCMVLDETTYKDRRVIDLLNTDFVPVYVDADERPDVNERYNRGGWPTTAVLTPDGRIITGQTYITADDLLELLKTADNAYQTGKDKVYQRIDAVDAAVKKAREKKEAEQSTQALSAAMPFSALKAVNLFVDPVYGGYGGPQKFPMAELLEFALYIYPKVKGAKEHSPENAVRLTLDGMADGLMDNLEGGFFRYSTSPDWKDPHYEKMLSTNADLLGVYMRAYQLLGDAKYLRVGESVALYLEGVLYDKGRGVFYNSQAADEQYYKLDMEGRLLRQSPPVDAVVFADSNARAALGYLSAYRATGREHYLDVARRAVDYAVGTMLVEGRGVLHYPGHDGAVLHLSDQVYTALAAEQLYQATGESVYLKASMNIAGVMVARFWDGEKGGFFDAYYGADPRGLLAYPQKPQIENSKAAVLLMDLYHITGDKAYKETARRTLEPFTADYIKYSYWAAPFAQAVERVIEDTYEFIIVGKAGAMDTAELIGKSYLFEDPDRVVILVDPERDSRRLAELGYRYSGGALLYVCSDKACFPPVKPGDSLKQTTEHIEKSRLLKDK